MTRPYGPDPYRRGSALSRSFVPLALITVGVVVLLSNFASNFISDRSRGGLIVFGLGAAFAVGRVATGRYGYAVPAGILMALGAHFAAQSIEIARGASGAGVFFVLLGLGFGLIYVIGLRPSAVWPLFPAVILVGLGVVLLGVASLGPLASWSWIASFWPAALILLGAWLLFRDSLPAGARGPIATLGGMALLIYGVVAAAASIAAAGSFARAGAPAADVSPFGDTMTLDAPLTAGQTLQVTNTSGTTTIHATSAPNVHVVVTRHFAFGGQAPDVRLTPVDNGLSLGSARRGGFFPFGESGSLDYTIDVPTGAAVNAQSSSGKLTIDGVNGAVNATSTSGAMDLSNLGGAVQAKAMSGSIHLTNIGGEVRASTTSGSISGTQLQHVRAAQSTSGGISLEGVFADQASITATSGSVKLTLSPGSAIVLDAHTTGSGSIQPQNLLLTGGLTRRDILTGAVGTPGPDATLHVQTTSGTIVIGE
jgi:putative adhesin